MRVAMLVLNDMTADARVSREAAALAAAGHDVHVLALRTSAMPDEETVDGYTVRRVADYTRSSWSRPLRKAAELRERGQLLASAAAALAPDVVHCHDSDTLDAGFRTAAAVQAKVVYDAHELYPDMLQEHGLQGSWPVQTYWRRIERRYVPRADAVVTVSDGLAHELSARFGVTPVVVANVPPLLPLERTGRLRRELGVGEDVFVALYQGVLMPGRGLDGLFRAAATLPDPSVLAVQGFGSAEEILARLVADEGLGGKVRLMGRKAQADLHEYACDADAGVVIYEPTTLNNRLAAPNKLFAYLMAGLPVAASDFPGLSSIVDAERVGVLFDGTDPASIADALRRLQADSDGRREMGARARRLAETRYNWDAEKRKLLGVYELLGGTR